ncbi:YvrJ family protein [Pectinatus brassicae]|uniref:YvrJ family protein n=1 Tax=Pectinatus brassicae TaxID=862415 RepID=A0A840UQ04_9FIRM|nr:YvrJ family protein [Pectinatus brassicae]MBB5336798.1 hypothetical protein [Pectinatus brassicae]
MNDWMNYVANGYFPILVTAFLLVRIESKIAALDSSIKELTRIIEKHS